MPFIVTQNCSKWPKTAVFSPKNSPPEYTLFKGLISACLSLSVDQSMLPGMNRFPKSRLTPGADIEIHVPPCRVHRVFQKRNYLENQSTKLSIQHFDPKKGAFLERPKGPTFGLRAQSHAFQHPYSSIWEMGIIQEFLIFPISSTFSMRFPFR